MSNIPPVPDTLLDTLAELHTMNGCVVELLEEYAPAFDLNIDDLNPEAVETTVIALAHLVKFYHERSVKIFEEMGSIGRTMIDINNL